MAAVASQVHWVPVAPGGGQALPGEVAPSVPVTTARLRDRICGRVRLWPRQYLVAGRFGSSQQVFRPPNSSYSRSYFIRQGASSRYGSELRILSRRADGVEL